jgi:hypothetical protein
VVDCVYATLLAYLSKHLSFLVLIAGIFPGIGQPGKDLRQESKGYD